MRVAVVGGTGLVGGHVVAELTASGHEAIVVSRSHGVDVVTGDGLDERLAGAGAVVDALNTGAQDLDDAIGFFGATTANLLASEQRAGVGHHVLLSIVGIDRIDGNAHYAGKRRQEELIHTGPVPFTIVRATQFYEFAEMVVGWTRHGDTATVAPLLVQPAAAADIGQVLAEISLGPPHGGTIELAGPEAQDLVDMARRTFAARGERLHLVPTWRGPFGAAMAGEVLLPGPEARLTSTTFDSWLESLT